MLRHGVKDLLILTSLATALFALVGWAAGEAPPPQAPTRPPQAPPVQQAPAPKMVVFEDEEKKKTVYVWKKAKGDPYQRLLFADGKHVGNWDAEDKTYCPLIKKGKWGKACKPPIKPPKVKMPRVIRHAPPPQMFFGGGRGGGGC